MAEDRHSTDSGGGTYAFGVQELVGDAQLILKSFVLLVESIGGTIEYPFHKLTDPDELLNRVVYVEYDGNEMIRYTVKHHEVITGELVAPDRKTESVLDIPLQQICDDLDSL